MHIVTFINSSSDHVIIFSQFIISRVTMKAISIDSFPREDGSQLVKVARDFDLAY